MVATDNLTPEQGAWPFFRTCALPALTVGLYKNECNVNQCIVALLLLWAPVFVGINKYVNHSLPVWAMPKQICVAVQPTVCGCVVYKRGCPHPGWHRTPHLEQQPAVQSGTSRPSSPTTCPPYTTSTNYIWGGSGMTGEQCTVRNLAFRPPWQYQKCMFCFVRKWSAFVLTKKKKQGCFFRRVRFGVRLLPTPGLTPPTPPPASLSFGRSIFRWAIGPTDMVNNCPTLPCPLHIRPIYTDPYRSKKTGFFN